MMFSKLLHASIFLTACSFEYKLPKMAASPSDMASSGLPSAGAAIEDLGMISDLPSGNIETIFPPCSATASATLPPNFSLTITIPPFKQDSGKQFLCGSVVRQDFIAPIDLNSYNFLPFKISYKSKSYSSYLQIGSNNAYGLYNEEIIIKLYNEDNDELILGTLSGFDLSQNNWQQEVEIPHKLPVQFPSPSKNHKAKGLIVVVNSHYSESNNFKTQTNSSLFPSIFFTEKTVLTIK